MIIKSPPEMLLTSWMFGISLKEICRVVGVIPFVIKCSPHPENSCFFVFIKDRSEARRLPGFIHRLHMHFSVRKRFYFESMSNRSFCLPWAMSFDTSLCNPSTGERLPLPLSPYSGDVARAGYKILRACSAGNPNFHHREIFTLGGTRGWRIIHKTPRYPLDSKEICIDSTINWPACTTVHDFVYPPMNKCLTAFHVRRESFQCTPLPPEAAAWDPLCWPVSSFHLGAHGPWKFPWNSWQFYLWLSSAYWRIKRMGLGVRRESSSLNRCYMHRFQAMSGFL